MRIAPEGYREIGIATVFLGAISAACAVWFPWGIAPCVIVWLWVLSFFRDPDRKADYTPDRLYSPADGTVADIAIIDHPDLPRPALRIGIFLSIFNVHVNRSPCAVRIRSITYKPGAFLDARHPDAGSRNESNTLLVDPADGLPGPLIIRQISGKIARRIICHAKVGDPMPAGHRFGMIKFGSRTELIMPANGYDAAVKVGDKVHGGQTVLAHTSRK